MLNLLITGVFDVAILTLSNEISPCSFIVTSASKGTIFISSIVIPFCSIMCLYNDSCNLYLLSKVLGTEARGPLNEGNDCSILPNLPFIFVLKSCIIFLPVEVTSIISIEPANRSDLSAILTSEYNVLPLSILLCTHLFNSGKAFSNACLCPSGTADIIVLSV